MWCPKRGVNCINYSCSEAGKICDSWNGNNDSNGIKSTREQQLEEEVKILKQRIHDLEIQLFNKTAAAPAYKPY